MITYKNLYSFTPKSICASQKICTSLFNQYYLSDSILYVVVIMKSPLLITCLMEVISNKQLLRENIDDSKESFAGRNERFGYGNKVLIFRVQVCSRALFSPESCFVVKCDIVLLGKFMPFCVFSLRFVLFVVVLVRVVSYLIWFLLNLLYNENLYCLLCCWTNLIFWKIFVPDIWAKMFSASQIAGFFNLPYIQNKSLKWPDFLHVDTNSHKLKLDQKVLGCAWSEMGQSVHRTLTLTVFQEGIDGINWFFDEKWFNDF